MTVAQPPRKQGSLAKPFSEKKSIFQFVKESVSLKEVILQSGVHITKSGDYFKGDCPFCDKHGHNFTVEDKRGIYYCFECHTGGDVISFIAKYKEETQIAALLYLIELYQITIPQDLQEQIEVLTTPPSTQKIQQTIYLTPDQKISLDRMVHYYKELGEKKSCGDILTQHLRENYEKMRAERHKKRVEDPYFEILPMDSSIK